MSRCAGAAGKEELVECRCAWEQGSETPELPADVAARMLKVDNEQLLDGVKPVGNTLVSLTGYQAQGYAIIPIY